MKNKIEGAMLGMLITALIFSIVFGYTIRKISDNYEARIEVLKSECETK